jgi:hypothetical protein
LLNNNNIKQHNNMATITLTEKEAMEYFHTALCNGLTYYEQYGIELTWKKTEYMEARKRLELKKPNEALCYEDIYIEILEGGGTLTTVDHENGEEDKVITKADVIERMALVPHRHLYDMMEENDDADTGDAILQTVFFKEILFG